MRITEIAIDSFGHWKGLRIPNLSDPVTVIHGPNEAGKSTILQLVRAVLYGFSARRHGRFVPPLHEGRVGGTVYVEAPNGRFQVRRWLAKSGRIEDDPQGELSVQSVDGAQKGKYHLATLLGGVDEQLFQSVFAVGLTEMQRLGTLSDTEVAQQLFGLATGADRVSIADVLRQLKQERSMLVNGDHASSIAQLLSRAESLTQEQQRSNEVLEQWLALRDELRQIETELKQSESRRHDFGVSVNGASPSQALREQWRMCRELQKQLDAVGPLPDIPSDVLDRLDTIAQQVRKYRTQWETQRDRRRALKQQASQLERQPKLLQHGEPIEALTKRRASVASQLEELCQLLSKSEEIEFELQAELERLGIKAGWQLDSIPLITEEMIATLREPARAARDARRSLEAAEKEYEQHQEVIDQFQHEVERELDGTGYASIADATRKVGDQVALLQQRMQADVQLTKLRRNQHEAREEAHYWNQREVPSKRGLMVIGLIFTSGVIIMLVALFHSIFGLDDGHRGLVAILGLAVTAVAVVMKNVVEFAAGRRAVACQDEIRQLDKEIKQTEQQIQLVDRKLPSHSEPLAIRLQQKQDELDRLSQLTPLESHRASELELAEQTLQRKQDTALTLKQARQNWRERLRSLGLPEGMTPAQFRQISQPDGKLGRLRKTMVDLRQEIDLRQSEIESVRQRVQLLAERIDMIFEGDQLEDQIDELAHALQIGRQHQQQRDKLHRQWRQLGRDQEKLARTAKRLHQRRQKLVVKYGVVDAHELKDVIKRRSDAAELKAKRDEIIAQMAGQLGACCSSEDLFQQLKKGGFEKRLSQLESEQQQVVARIASLHERRGELNEKLKSLSRSQQLAANRLEANEVQQQLSQATHEWARTAAVSCALDQVRNVYESDQQPESLAEASAYLAQLTDGRYHRIWTPFGESSLRVDSKVGRSASIEHLSRGTREQVFLSLRMALAAAYSRRGAPMPMIFDDVLVNFDAHRAEAAAQTLCQFAAAGHQVLVFTCHDHIRSTFQSLDVDVRGLPSPTSVAQRSAAVLPDRSDNAGKSMMAGERPSLTPDNFDNGLPSENDEELDRELMSGAPQYDPGYVAPQFPDDPAVETNARAVAAPIDSSWAARYDESIRHAQ